MRAAARVLWTGVIPALLTGLVFEFLVPSPERADLGPIGPIARIARWHRGAAAPDQGQ